MAVDYWERILGRYYRTGSRLLFKRPLVLKSNAPVISFTFDDFPRSAFLTGGLILKSFGVVGTYYASFGLMGKKAASGLMFLAEDVNALSEEGHELGCHTFSHCHSSETKVSVFEKSIIDNRRALTELLPGASFKTFSYPISPPRILTKHRVAKYFVCCRGGGQGFNSGIIDLNYLSAYFLEKCNGNAESVKKLIDGNHEAGGWLIFATHDISSAPTPFGCKPKFFEGIVRYAVSSGAQILPVAQAWAMLDGTGARKITAQAT